MPQPAKSRRFTRVKAEHAVMVRLLGTQRFEEFARTRILGPGGCMFVSEESLGFGSLMELSIALQGRVLKTDSRVVYEISKSPTEHQVGVEFLRIAPADRAFLESFIATRKVDGAGNGQVSPRPS
ncbi:MAG TPA: PilZ domain-containing protein [Thermoanaerobaculia bacterium]|nr:PilZ domain-containing protein [Thermoanaerobaculia bacterium]